MGFGHYGRGSEFFSFGFHYLKLPSNVLSSQEEAAGVIMMSRSHTDDLALMCPPLVMSLIEQGKVYFDTRVLNFDILDKIPPSVYNNLECDPNFAYEPAFPEDHRNGWWFTLCA